MSTPDVAIAHDYLTQRGGAEKVVLALTRAFPDAAIHTTLYEPERTYPEFAHQAIRTTWLNRFALLRRSHRLAMPLLAWTVGRTTIDAKHTIASSSGWAHGFRTTGSKIVYCHSPARWLYQPDAYFGSKSMSVKRLVLKTMAPALKRWDRRKAATATTYFANSTVVQQRIRDAYGIEAEVLPAPHSVNTEAEKEPVDLGPLAGQPSYLCVSRLLPYKNVDVVVEAFTKSGRPLVVVGAGPEERDLASLAGPNVIMRKNLSDAQMRWLYARCTAVLSASYEDFGLTPIEAAAYGRPCIVLRWGGFLDTVREGITGVYFNEPRADLIETAVKECEAIAWNGEAIREHAQTFSEERFAERLHEAIGSLTRP